MSKSKLRVALLGFAISLLPYYPCAADGLENNITRDEITPRNLSLQLGWVNLSQSYTQHVDMYGAIGDTFATTTRDSNSGLVGVGYYPFTQASHYYDLSYGLNAFYLGRTLVSGIVLQEKLYSNLSF